MRLKWTNWQIYQQLTGNTLQQVDSRIAKVILKCGFSWSPAMSPNLPILLTPLRKRGDIGLLAKLGFELEEDKTVTPTLENGFDYSGYISSSWEALGLKQQQQQHQQTSEDETSTPSEEHTDPHAKLEISDFVQKLGQFWDKKDENKNGSP